MKTTDVPTRRRSTSRSNTSCPVVEGDSRSSGALLSECVGDVVGDVDARGEAGVLEVGLIDLAGVVEEEAGGEGVALQEVVDASALGPLPTVRCAHGSRIDCARS